MRASNLACQLYRLLSPRARHKAIPFFFCYVSYRDNCIGIRIVSWKNVSLQAYKWVESTLVVALVCLKENVYCNSVNFFLDISWILNVDSSELNSDPEKCASEWMNETFIYPRWKITSTITLNTSWFSCKPCTNYLKYPKTTTNYNIKI